MSGSEMASISGRAADEKVYLSARRPVCWAAGVRSDPCLAARSCIGTHDKKAQRWLSVAYQISESRLAAALQTPSTDRCTRADCSTEWSLVMPKLAWSTVDRSAMCA